MSDAKIHKGIREHPKFSELVTKRTRFAVMLSLLVLVPYYSFIMLVAFAPGSLQTVMLEGSSITIVWPLGVLLIIGPWLLTGIYVHRANSDFDKLNQEVLKEVNK